MPNKLDPPWLVSCVLHDTGESWAFISVPLTEGIDSHKLYFPVTDPLDGSDDTPESYCNIVRQTYGFTSWASWNPGEDNTGDNLLFSVITKAKYSEVEDGKGSINLTPVIAILDSDPDAVIPKPRSATLIEGVLSCCVTFNATTKDYHLWYWIEGWTSATRANTFDYDGNLSPLATLPYKDSDAINFDPDDWFVVPQKGFRYEDVLCTARILLHTRGQRVVLADDDEEERVYLVVDEPEVVSIWPLLSGCASSSAAGSSSSSMIATSSQSILSSPSSASSQGMSQSSLGLSSRTSGHIRTFRSGSTFTRFSFSFARSGDAGTHLGFVGGASLPRTFWVKIEGVSDGVATQASNWNGEWFLAPSYKDEDLELWRSIPTVTEYIFYPEADPHGIPITWQLIIEGDHWTLEAGAGDRWATFEYRGAKPDVNVSVQMQRTSVRTEIDSDQPICHWPDQVIAEFRGRG